MSDKKNYTLSVEQNAEGAKLAFFHPEGDDNVSYRIAGPKAWGGSKQIAKLRISHYDLIVAIKEFAPGVHAELLQEQSSELSDLREKCAELERSLISEKDMRKRCEITRDEMTDKYFAAQRQLDEAANQEPVGRSYIDGNGNSHVWLDVKLPDRTDVYAHPINLLAIIEQAKAEEREACAKICEAMNPFVVINGERWNKNGDGALFRLLDVAPNLERMHMNKLAFEGRSVEDEHNEHPVQKCAAAIRARKP